jgi:hypothetical protein
MLNTIRDIGKYVNLRYEKIMVFMDASHVVINVEEGTYQEPAIFTTAAVRTSDLSTAARFEKVVQ